LGFITADIKFIVNDWLMHKNIRIPREAVNLRLKVVGRGKVGLISQGPGNSVLNHESKFYTLVFSYRKTDRDEARPAE
jgi:hypothetical protein